jgi:hypothetical protein
MHNLFKNVSLREINAPVAAGSSIDDNSDIIDMAGFEGALFFVPVTDSVATGVATLTIEQNIANSGTGMAALSGAVATATCATNDDLNNKVLVVDVYRPKERYLQAVLTSATANIAFGNTIVLLYNKKGLLPISTDASVLASAVVASPNEA